MPRPKMNPSVEQREKIKIMAACGIPQEEMVKQIGIRSAKTLRKYFRQELDRASVEANCTVARALFKKARDGDVEAGKFWLKCRAGWREHPGFASSASALPPFVVAKDDGVQQP